MNLATAQYGKFEDEKGGLTRQYQKEKQTLEKAQRDMHSLRGNQDQIDAINRNGGRDCLSLRQFINRPEIKGKFKRSVYGPLALDVVVQR